MADAKQSVMITSYKGELEIDAGRGVVYFHTSDEEVARRFGSVLLMRICGLPTPTPERAIDITLIRVDNKFTQLSAIISFDQS